MFSNIFFHSLRRVLRQRSVLFWSLAFPLILSTLFHLGFGNIYQGERLEEPIRIAYVAGEQASPFFSLRDILSSIPLGEGEEQALFDIKDLDETSAREQLQQDGVDAIVLDGAQPSILVSAMEKNQVLIKQVLDQVLSTGRTMTSLLLQNPQADVAGAMALLQQQGFVKKLPLLGGRMNPDIIYYMALLAMTCLGASGSGVEVVLSQQANRSSEGARLAASPASKWLRVFASGLASYLVQLGLSLLVLVYMRFALGKHFGDDLAFLLLVLSTGTATGFLMGMAIAALVRGSNNTVQGISSGIYLFSSFLTGLMSVEVKRLVETKLPLLGQINPGTLIVDAMNSSYYFQQPDLAYILRMALACLVFAAIAASALVRKYHDSI